MPALLVELKVPIETEPLIGAPALSFSRWLPLEGEDVIRVSEDGVELKLWFDIKTSGPLSPARKISRNI